MNAEPSIRVITQSEINMVSGGGIGWEFVPTIVRAVGDFAVHIINAIYPPPAAPIPAQVMYQYRTELARIITGGVIVVSSIAGLCYLGGKAMNLYQEYSIMYHEAYNKN